DSIGDARENGATSDLSEVLVLSRYRRRSLRRGHLCDPCGQGQHRSVLTRFHATLRQDRWVPCGRFVVEARQVARDDMVGDVRRDVASKELLADLRDLGGADGV